MGTGLIYRVMPVGIASFFIFWELYFSGGGGGDLVSLSFFSIFFFGSYKFEKQKEKRKEKIKNLTAASLEPAVGPRLNSAGVECSRESSRVRLPAWEYIFFLFFCWGGVEVASGVGVILKNYNTCLLQIALLFFFARSLLLSLCVQVMKKKKTMRLVFCCSVFSFFQDFFFTESHAKLQCHKMQTRLPWVHNQ